MSEVNGINIFGSLTSKVNGQKISFDELKEFDENANGVIESGEFKKALNELKLDSVSFSTVDTNKDKSISEEEFRVWDQKTQMQEAVNAKLNEIYNDSVLNKYLSSIKQDLKLFLDSFISEYNGKTSEMSDKFKTALEAKVKELKQSSLSNDPTVVKGEVLDGLYQFVLFSRDADGKQFTKDETSVLLQTLEKEADKFISSYKGNNLKSDLETYLKEYFSESDRDRVDESIKEYKNSIAGLGAYVTSEDYTNLKTSVKTLLEGIVNKGVTIRVGNINIASTAAINSALAQFTDANQLLTAINDALESLSKAPRKDSLIKEVRLKTEQENLKKLAQVQGSEYQVNAGLLDWSKVDSRYFNGEEIYERGKGWSGSRDKAYDEGLKVLNGDGLKNQIKSHIEQMLKSKNIPQDIYENMLNNVFENVYNQSVVETLNAEGMITGRGARGLSSKGKAYINVKTLCDTFVTNFNNNIQKSVDEMNASFTDFDTVDIDYSELNKDENGNTINDADGDAILDNSSNKGDIAKSYATGVPLTTRKHGADYYNSIAEKVIDGLKSQMLKKTMAMCKANGVKFDMTIFNTMFNNAKSLAVNAAVTGVTSDGASVGGINTTGAIIGGAAGLAGVCGLGAVYGGAAAVAAGGGFMTGALAGAAAVAFPYGAAVAAIGALAAGVISSITGGQSSECTMNTRLLVDGFTEAFKQTYTAWIDQEKNNAKTA